MARHLDKILVIDVESTCWEGRTPAGQESEIIEIGLCLLDVGTLQREEKHSVLVRPERSTVSAFCTSLTTLTQADVEGGVSLREACQTLADTFNAKRRTWASYGDYDRRQFERTCRAQGVPYPLGTSHVNVKNLFALAHGLRREVGMARALSMLGLPLEGTHHRGGDDAYNIAGILAVLLRSMRDMARGNAVRVRVPH
jgi:inhibitor of KinA sporulation pathway (predicted exonuclease)